MAFGKVGKFRYRNAEEVLRHCHRLAVEITRSEVFVLFSEKERVVSYAVDFVYMFFRCIPNGIKGGSQYLRNAAQRISILHFALISR